MQKKAVTCLYVAGRGAPGACVTDGESVAHRLEKCTYTGATSSAPQLPSSLEPCHIVSAVLGPVCLCVGFPPSRSTSRSVPFRVSWEPRDDPAWTLEPLHSSNTYTQTHNPAREPTTPLGWFDRVLAARFPSTWNQLAGARDGSHPKGVARATRTERRARGRAWRVMVFAAASRRARWWMRERDTDQID